MYINNFEEYLNHYKITKADEEYECDKGNVFFYTNKYKSGAVLSRAYFDVLDAWVDKADDNGKLLTVTAKVKWKGIKKKDSTKNYSIILYRGNKIEWDDIKKDLENFGEPQEKFYRLCSDYLKRICTDCWQQYKEQPYIGWVGGDEDSCKTFLGVNEYGDALNDRYPCLFNGDVERYKRKQDWQECDFQEVFDWLLGDYNLLGIFVYTLHALLFYYSGGVKNAMESEEVFAICIHGRDMEKVKIIANLLSNLFEYSNDKMNLLNRGSYFSCSSLEKQKAVFYRIESVPLIVCNKSGKLTRSTSIITTMRNQRLKGRIAYFPVFLSQNAINADEILNFCVDDISARSDYGDWKAKVNYLLIQFIIYLKDVEDNPDKRLNAPRNILDDWYITKEKELASEKAYMSCEAYSKRLLFVACGIFAKFLEEQMKYVNIASRFHAVTGGFFWKNAASEKTFVNATKEISIKSFAAFINATLQKEEQERELLCVRQIDKKSSESFIYIDYDECGTHYIDYCKANHIDYFDIKAIAKRLKEKNILKLRTNKAQYAIQKSIEFQGIKEKKSVLAIEEAAFKRYLNGV